MILLTLKCPKCNHDQNYQLNGSILNKKKKCVFCGKTFQVRPNVLGQAEKKKAPDQASFSVYQETKF